MITDIVDQLKRDEGLRLVPYLDTVGKSTVGYGHNLIANPLTLTYPITEAKALEILLRDVAVTKIHLVDALPWLVEVDEYRQGVLINMAFNIGVHGVIGFQQMLKYLRAMKYDGAAMEMKDSKWYEEVGQRARRLVTQMQEGVWI